MYEEKWAGYILWHIVLSKVHRSVGLPLTPAICCIYFWYMKTIINIKADKEVKKDAQRIAEELGLSLSAVMNAYLKEFIREREVTFSLEPQIRPEIGRMFKKASADYRKGKNISPVFTTAKEAIAYLKR